MTAVPGPEERYELITRRLQEVLGGEAIKSVLREGKTPKCYWGKIHMRAFCWLALSLKLSCKIVKLQEQHLQDDVSSSVQDICRSGL
jgi:hypothetical protein